MCVTGYWFIKELDENKVRGLSEPIPGPTSTFLAELARHHDMIVAAGTVEEAADGSLYNTYIVALPDGTIHRHRKLHCFISKHMSSGDQYTVFDSPFGWKIGVLICYDNNIIENVRMTALMGADILLAPHQTGGCKTISPHCMGVIDRKLWEQREDNPAAIEAEFKGPKGRDWLMKWLPARAHDNGLFLLFANGVGVDGNEIRTGNAMIIDCYGNILQETWKAEDAMVVADLDPELLHNCTGRRWIRSRRPDLYGPVAVATGNEVDIYKARFG